MSLAPEPLPVATPATVGRIPAATVWATLAGAGLLALSSVAGSTFVVLAVALGGFVLAFGLPLVTGATSLVRSTGALAAATVLAAWAVLVVEGEPPLRLVPVAVAASLVLTFLAQLTRSDNRPQLARCLVGDALGITAIVSGMALAPLVDLRPDDVVIGAAMAGIVAASLLDPLVGRTAQGWLLPGALVLGASGAAAVGAASSSGASLLVYLTLGSVAGVGACAVRWVLADQSPAGRGALAIAVAGLLIPGLAVFAVARLLLG